LFKNETKILTDLGANPNDVTCDLQQVSWVIPDGNWSDHPGGPAAKAGPSWVAAIINAVGGYNNDGTATKGNCGYWGNTVILVTWDDWGGFYDDVLPWNCSQTGKCTGYSNLTGSQYVYGFRVPLLVVSAWTPQGYVSGSPSQGGETPPYVHDFGSILNFTEWALGQNQQPLSWPGQQNVSLGINPLYPYADYLAPDIFPSCPMTQCPQPWSLADFFIPFGTTTERDFVLIKGTNYPTSDFLDPSGTFTNYPMDPDNDVTDDD
jgi:phospholipase C